MNRVWWERRVIACPFLVSNYLILTSLLVGDIKCLLSILGFVPWILFNLYSTFYTHYYDYPALRIVGERRINNTLTTGLMQRYRPSSIVLSTLKRVGKVETVSVKLRCEVWDELKCIDDGR